MHKKYRIRKYHMSKVKENTDRTYEKLNKDVNCIAVIFEMNEGGHFTEPVKRVCKGMKWIDTQN